MDEKTASLQRLLTRYYDSEKDIFLHPNTSSILEDARANADYNLTSQDVLDYRASLYNISRSVEARELRGRRRYESTRKWECYGPGIRYNTIQYNTIQYNTIQYITKQYRTNWSIIQ